MGCTAGAGTEATAAAAAAAATAGVDELREATAVEGEEVKEDVAVAVLVDEVFREAADDPSALIPMATPPTPPPPASAPDDDIDEEEEDDDDDEVWGATGVVGAVSVATSKALMVAAPPSQYVLVGCEPGPSISRSERRKVVGSHSKYLR